MIKLIVSLLLSVGVCCAADDAQLPPDEQQEFMHTLLSKSQQEHRNIIDVLHEVLGVNRFQINDDQEVIYNGKIPEDPTLLGDVMHAMLAKQMHFDEFLKAHAHRLNQLSSQQNEHTRSLANCSASLAKLTEQMASFEDKTTQIIAHMSGRLSHLEIGLSGLEGKVDRLKQLLSDEQSTS